MPKNTNDNPESEVLMYCSSIGGSTVVVMNCPNPAAFGG